MPNLSSLDAFTVKHLKAWYAREFWRDHATASAAALAYLESLEPDELARVLDRGWPELAQSLNHYELYS